MKNPKDDQFDRLFSSVPANSAAARVTSRGTHYDKKLKEAPEIVHSDCPLPMQGADAIRWRKRTSPDFTDLTGTKTGRLTVIGLADIKYRDPNKKTPWVVRCACGKYEHRSSKAIKNPNNSEDACRACRDWQYVKRRYREMGSRDIQEFIKK
ncbi:MAG: hypothetical protein C5B54_09200 [Acidobacteria bacterium]|nr:MAG: hypothetical protein C5B54_09200 [Acidobacteriota bacterium]